MAKTEDEKLVDGLLGRWKVGTAYFVRTVTFHIIGRVVRVDGPFVYLSEACWIPNSGRFADFIEGKIEPEEVEPVGEWFFNENSVTDGCIWKHKIPRIQK